MDLQNIDEKLNQLLAVSKTVMTIDEVAKYSGMAKSYIYKLTSQKKIPFYKPNNKFIFFKRSEIEDWLLRNRSKTNEEINQEAENYLNQ